MALRILVYLTLGVTTAFAGWQRSVNLWNEDIADTPPPHPLKYFQVDPCLRPDTDALGQALDCTYDGAPAPSPVERERRVNTQTELIEVGRIGEFTIYDLWYSRGIPFPYPGPDVRSVLVKTGADEYRELDVRLRLGYAFPASAIVNLDGEPILIVKSHDGGNHNRIDREYYMFRQGEPARPNFQDVGRAVRELTLGNMAVLTRADDYDLMTVVVELYRNDLNLPPALVTERGRITVAYRFVDGRAVVTSSKYVPYSSE